MATKISALDKFLERHKDTCSYWIFSGDRHCSCGRDAALLELKELRESVPVICPKCLVEMHLMSDGQYMCLTEICERYGK